MRTRSASAAPRRETGEHPGCRRAPGRRILLADFGIARRDDDSDRLTANEHDGRYGGVLSAPEQLMGRPIDGRADQYALAATAFHLLTGSPRSTIRNQTVVISRHLTVELPGRDYRPELAALDGAGRGAVEGPPTALRAVHRFRSRPPTGPARPLPWMRPRLAPPHWPIVAVAADSRGPGSPPWSPWCLIVVAGAFAVASSLR